MIRKFIPAFVLLLMMSCSKSPQTQGRSVSNPPDAERLFRSVADAMPEYAEFLTVDEL